MLVKPTKPKLRLIDFGSCCFQEAKLYTYIQSRYYWAPEIILDSEYDTPIDIWSFGCMVAELYLGYPILTGESEQDQLAVICEVMGDPPSGVINRGNKYKDMFD